MVTHRAGEIVSVHDLELAQQGVILPPKLVGIVRMYPLHGKLHIGLPRTQEHLTRIA